MKYISYLASIMICITAGLAFHAYQKEWVILLLPHQAAENSIESLQPQTACSQKKITLYFYKHDTWHHEQTTVLWSDNVANNVKIVTNNWLTLLEEEKLLSNDVQVISAVLTSNKEMLLSLNKDLFSNQDATYQKLMLIESLLKTIRTNKIAIQSIRFLVHHQVMLDDHLNFSIPWPITGYLANK